MYKSTLQSQQRMTTYTKREWGRWEINTQSRKRSPNLLPLLFTLIKMVPPNRSCDVMLLRAVVWFFIAFACYTILCCCYPSAVAVASCRVLLVALVFVGCFVGCGCEADLTWKVFRESLDLFHENHRHFVKPGRRWSRIFRESLDILLNVHENHRHFVNQWVNTSGPPSLWESQILICPSSLTKVGAWFETIMIGNMRRYQWRRFREPCVSLHKDAKLSENRRLSRHW